MALWLVAAAEIRDGYERLLHFFVVTTGTIIVARLAGIVLLGALDRACASTPRRPRASRGWSSGCSTTTPSRAWR